jgi:hypothetical protein
MLFRSVTLRGASASIVWGYHTAAHLRGWMVTKADGRWALTAGVDRADPFQLQQRPLLFTAPRQGGRWCWPVQTVTLGAERLSATLGPPEA